MSRVIIVSVIGLCYIVPCDSLGCDAL